MGKEKKKTARNEDIVRMRGCGMTYAEIASWHTISSARVVQIVKKQERIEKWKRENPHG